MTKEVPSQPGQDGVTSSLSEVAMHQDPEQAELSLKDWHGAWLWYRLGAGVERGWEASLDPGASLLTLVGSWDHNGAGTWR